MIALDSILKRGPLTAPLASLSFLMAGASLQTPNADKADSPSATDRELPDSIIGATYGDLDELVVTAEKPMIKSDGSKLTYSVEEDKSSKGSTVLELLRKVPMVSVDGEGNIRLNGQENFKIYVNGKEDAFLSANYQKVLKAMPAKSISEIEVITDPDAKYDAEGTAGILNFKTERTRRDEGYSSSLSMNFSRLNTGASALGGIKKEKVSTNINIDYASNEIFGQSSENDREMVNLNSETDHILHEYAKQKNSWHYIGGKASLSWEPDIRNLFTLDMNITTMLGKVPGIEAYADMRDINGDLTWSYRRNINGRFGNDSYSANASYQHDFDGKGHKAILSYLFNFGKSDMTVASHYLDPEGIEFRHDRSSQSQTQYIRGNTVQADYINPLGEGRHNIEAGAKAVWRHNNAYGETLTSDRPDLSDGTISEKSNIIQFQDIYAAYASYTGTFNALTAKAGLRYEHTHMGIKSHIDDRHYFSTDLDDAMPNVSLTWSFSPTHNIRAAYSMRISRPGIEQTSPYGMQIEANIIRVGNPDLTSERSHRISLTYTNFGPRAGGNIGIEHTRINNSITRYTYFDRNIMYETYANIGNTQRTALTGFLTWQIIPDMRFNLNGRIEYLDMTSESPRLHNSGWSLNYGASWNYTFPNSISLSAYGGQQTRRYNLQGYSNGWYYYGIGVSRDFFGKVLNVALNASQFLQSSQSYVNRTETADMINSSIWTNSNWNVGISLTWNFGNVNTKTKKTDASIDNNDKADTGGSTNKGGL